jgi:hypothetical protein
VTCVAGDAIRRRTHESFSIAVDSHTVVIWASLEPSGWRGAWSGFGRTSLEQPIGGLEEQRYRNADSALLAAFGDALPAMRLMRGRPQ